MAFQSPSLSVKKTYDLATGMADYLKDLGFTPPKEIPNVQA